MHAWTSLLQMRRLLQVFATILPFCVCLLSCGIGQGLVDEPEHFLECRQFVGVESSNSFSIAPFQAQRLLQIRFHGDGQSTTFCW